MGVCRVNGRRGSFFHRPEADATRISHCRSSQRIGIGRGVASLPQRVVLVRVGVAADPCVAALEQNRPAAQLAGEFFVGDQGGGGAFGEDEMLALVALDGLREGLRGQCAGGAADEDGHQRHLVRDVQAPGVCVVILCAPHRVRHCGGVLRLLEGTRWPVHRGARQHFLAAVARAAAERTALPVRAMAAAGHQAAGVEIVDDGVPVGVWGFFTMFSRETGR